MIRDGLKSSYRIIILRIIIIINRNGVSQYDLINVIIDFIVSPPERTNVNVNLSFPFSGSLLYFHRTLMSRTIAFEACVCGFVDIHMISSCVYAVLFLCDKKSGRKV